MGGPSSGRSHCKGYGLPIWVLLAVKGREQGVKGAGLETMILAGGSCDAEHQTELYDLVVLTVV